MSISIIIPVYNEAQSVGVVIERLYAALPGEQVEVCVVDDGSTDRTARVLEQLAQRYPLRMLRHPVNAGKGAAVRSGLAAATGEIVVVQDADLEYDPQELTAVVQAFVPGVDAVFGSRMMHGVQGGYTHYVVGGKALNAWVNFLFKSSLTDAYTGVKAVRRSVLLALQLSATGFELEAEIVCKLLARRARIVEVPVRYTPRTFAEGKKIRPWDAWSGARMALRIFLNTKHTQGREH